MVIAHIADLHLSLLYRREAIRNLKRVLEHITRKNPDHVVVTGDISADARTRELHLARRVFESYGLFHTKRLTVLPGNHDIFGGVHTAEDVLAFPSRCRHTQFEERTEKFLEVFHEVYDGALHASRKQFFPFAKIVGNVALIGANSVMEHHPLKNPVGSNGVVGKHQLSRLEKLLSSGLLDHKNKVLLIHHHFHRAPSPSWSVLPGLWGAFENQTMKLRKKRRLLKVLREYEVPLVLHGHYHETTEYVREGIRFLNAGGTLLGPDPATLSYHLLSIENGMMESHVEQLPADQRSSDEVPIPRVAVLHAAA
jgi:3',5'-cyclic AMP phosphodiesterase CpdA